MAVANMISKLRLLLLIPLLLMVMPAQPVYAAGIVVSTHVDEDASNGTCSLREAITAANMDAAYNGCSKGFLFDTITFAGNYTITLGSQLPQIISGIAITGNGAANTVIQASTCNPVTLPGGCTPADYRVLEVSASWNLTVNNLTIANGKDGAGGGIKNAGSLSVSKSTFSGNSAFSGGGIQNVVGGTITSIANSTFSGNRAPNGGGIYNYGTITSIANSTFSGNSGGYGGGIFNNDGTISTIANSTFSGNSVAYFGGGIANGTGGTISTIANCTFSGNSASSQGGGIINFSGNTISTIANTIISNSPSGGNCSGTAPGTNTSDLTDSAGCHWDSTNWPNQTLDVAADLGPLASNGGSTRTHALLGSAATNPAIDTGDAGTCSSSPVSGKDQRGITRPTACDIGAFEASPSHSDSIICFPIKTPDAKIVVICF